MYRYILSWIFKLWAFIIQSIQCVAWIIHHDLKVMLSNFKAFLNFLKYINPSNAYTQIISGSCDKTIKIWNVIAECKYTMSDESHTEPVTAVRFSPIASKPVFVSSGLDKKVKVSSLIRCWSSPRTLKRFIYIWLYLSGLIKEVFFAYTCISIYTYLCVYILYIRVDR